MTDLTHNYRLANIIGLDTGSAQHNIAIVEAIHGVDDMEAFFEYCRDHKEGIQYATKTERLDTLATKYKKLQNQAKIPLDTAASFSKSLAAKVEQARTTIKDLNEKGVKKPFAAIRLNGDYFFSEKEQNALKELGSTLYVVELSETHQIAEKLMDLFVSKFQSKTKYAALTEGQKKVSALIVEAIKQWTFLH